MSIKFSPGCGCCEPAGPCPCGPVSTYIACCGSWTAGAITNLKTASGATQNGTSAYATNHGTTTALVYSFGSIVSVGAWTVPTTSGTMRVEVVYTDENGGLGTPSYMRYYAWFDGSLTIGYSDTDTNIGDNYCFGRIAVPNGLGGTTAWQVTGTDCSTNSTDYRCQNGCRQSAVSSITHNGTAASQDAGIYSKDRAGRDVWSFQTSSTQSFSLRKLSTKWQIASGFGNSGTGTTWEDIASSNVCNGTVNSTYGSPSKTIVFTVTGATC